MKVEVLDDGSIGLNEVYNPVVLKTSEGEVMSIVMRDTGFEFCYQGEWYFAKEGHLEKFKTSSRGNLLVDQRHIETSEQDGSGK